jgi:hypothetical protein
MDAKRIVEVGWVKEELDEVKSVAAHKACWDGAQQER